MTFPILGGNGAVAGYSIDNSLRFNDNDSANLSRTQSASNRKTFTISAWVKRANLVSASNRIFSASSHSGLACVFGFQSNNTFLCLDESISFNLTTTQVFRDVSSWYHFVIAIDTTQSTANDRLKMYVNGSQITSFSTQTNPSQNADGFVNSNCKHTIGSRTQSGGDSEYFDGYIAEFNFIDGQQLSPTDFGEFDEDSGIWKPKEYTGSYGTNGFYLDFSNSGTLGEDFSGNDNDFTATNLASTDQTTDTPTNNFCTMNPLEYTGATYGTGTLSEGNCKVTIGDNNTNVASFTLNQGKWYWEQKHISSASSQNRIEFGIIQQDVPDYIGGDSLPNTSGKGLVWGGFGDLRGYISTSSFGTFAPNDIIGCALDMDAQTLQFYKNGSAVSTAQDFSGAGWTNVSPTVFCSNNAGNEVGEINFGNPSFSISSGNSDDNGYGNFEYAPPSGYLALCTQNLATELSPTIDDGSQYFNSILYTGTSVNPTSRTGVGFQPDWIWAKERSSTSSHRWIDSSRGNDKVLESNATDAEVTRGDIQSFDSDGFTTDDGGAINESGQTYVAWNWKANAGSTSSNTDGDITSTVQANTTAGFSIGTYTGDGNNTHSVGHGLGTTPAMIIVKRREGSHSWIVWHQKLTATTAYALDLENTDAEANNTSYFYDTAPDANTFHPGNGGATNGSGGTYVFYAFKEIEGYSKFGKYTGNGSSDGTFIYTGFRPAFVIIKRTDSAGNDWIIIDTKRFTYNQISSYLRANTSDAETDQYNIDEDIVSNGFKLRGDSGNINASGSTYIYMAFAENPFVTSTGIPVTAR